MPSRGKKNRKYKARKLAYVYRGILVRFFKIPSKRLQEHART